MKKFVFLILAFVVFGVSSSKGQKINYQISFDLAKEKSKSLDKVLFLKIDHQHSNSKFDTNITEPHIIRTINHEFVSYNGKSSEKEMVKIISRYKITFYPALLFFDSKGGLIYKDFGKYKQAEDFNEVVKKVKELNKSKSLQEYDTDYKLGNFDREFLKNYINRRIDVGLTNNSGIIDCYINFLKVSELSNYDEVLFVLKAGPLAYGKAYNIINVNRKLVDSVYKKEPKEVGVEINNRIINNTISYAIYKKSNTWANAAANFTRKSWGKDYTKGDLNATGKLLYYYKCVRDTANFLRTATYYYDRYYMNIDKDSADRVKKETLKDIQMAQLTGKNSFSVVRSVASVANELNNAAYYVAKTGTTNTIYLNKALAWSKRSIELEEVYGYYDTYAYLLYLSGYYAEAEVKQNTAIEMAKARKLSTASLEMQLDKIKNRTL